MSKELFSMKLDDPALDIDKMEMNNIMILIGQNGTGKTFIMICHYVIQSILVGAVQKVPSLEELAQTIFDLCFDEVNWTGEMKFEDEHNSLEIIFDKGKVIKVNCTIIDEKSIRSPMYLSKNTRQFPFIVGYLQARKAFTPQGRFDETSFEKLSKMYKMYDITFMESLIARSPIPAPLDFVTDYNFKVQPEKLIVDTDVCTIQVEQAGTMKTASIFSAGEQALMIMFFGIPQ
jgi:hypothetical protein